MHLLEPMRPPRGRGAPLFLREFRCLITALATYDKTHISITAILQLCEQKARIAYKGRNGARMSRGRTFKNPIILNSFATSLGGLSDLVSCSASHVTARWRGRAQNSKSETQKQRKTLFYIVCRQERSTKNAHSILKHTLFLVVQKWTCRRTWSQNFQKSPMIDLQTLRVYSTHDFPLKFLF